MYLILNVHSLYVATREGIPVSSMNAIQSRGDMRGFNPWVDEPAQYPDRDGICGLEGSLRAKRLPQGSSGLTGTFFQYIWAARNKDIERIMG